MKDIAIEVKNLSVKYFFIRNTQLKKELAKFITGNKIEKRKKEIWALKNISFKIHKGHTVGIIGTNGSGKSTLLKVIANIFKPDSGEVNTYTDSVSLLALGAGFQPELSGIENIYLNGLLLGMKRKEIDKRLEQIIGFSELGDFVYYPIRTYSSGMKTRLAFSIAAHIEPEILLIDEVLGVGDEAFKKKSSEKIKELIKENRTVLIVSHSLDSIRELCDSVIWLHNGVLMDYDVPDKVISKYKNYLRKVCHKGRV